MKITLNEHLLAGGASAHEEPTHMELSAQRSMQTIRAIRAPAIQTCDRGNLQIKLTFEVGRHHKNQAEASRHMLLHASKITQAQGALRIELEDKLNQVFILESAILQHIQTHYKGSASYTTYEIYGGNLYVNQ